MSRRPLFFLLVAAAQLAALLWMAGSRERVLRGGEPFRFRTAPVDPRDPFRGEYVQLSFEAEQGDWAMPRPVEYAAGQEAYAVIERGPSGFARIASLYDRAPAGAPCVKVAYREWGGGRVQRVELPFDRFYLEEGDGRRTERLLAPRWEEPWREEPLPAYALVRVRGGQAVIEDLIVADRPLRDWLGAGEEQAAAWRAEALRDSALRQAVPAGADTLAAPR